MGQENSEIVLIFITSAAIVVFMAVILVLFLVIYQKRIVTQENQLQKLENERQQMLLKATIEGQERERSRLAKDLHDGIGSLLSGLSLNLKFQQKNLSPGDPQTEFLYEACKLVDEGIENVRRVSHNLMPATLEKFGLLQAIKDYNKPFQNKHGLEINIETNSNPVQFPMNVTIGLLRIYQELLNNTYRHSEATKVWLRINQTSGMISVNYQDNGKGIEDNEKSPDGIGLKNIQSRVLALEGTCEFVIPSKVGFEARIKIPFNS